MVKYPAIAFPISPVAHDRRPRFKPLAAFGFEGFFAAVFDERLALVELVAGGTVGIAKKGLVVGGNTEQRVDGSVGGKWQGTNVGRGGSGEFVEWTKYLDSRSVSVRPGH